MVQLHGPDLDILIYPMDLLISGKPELVARARAAMASRLTTSAAHLTVSAEAQAVEDLLTTLGTGSDETVDPPRFDAAAAAAFAEDRRHLSRDDHDPVRGVGGPGTASASRSSETCGGAMAGEAVDRGRQDAGRWSGAVPSRR